MPREPARVGYVLKVFPRLSETFVVNEILAHERAGIELEVFSLRAPAESLRHESLDRVRAPVTYLPAGRITARELWAQIGGASAELPGLAAGLPLALDEELRDFYQALVLARAARSRGLTHLHAHFASVATTVTRVAGLLTALPYSFTAHAKDIFHESVRPEDLRGKLAEAATVITVSDHNAEHLRPLEPAADVHRVYNGVELSRYPYSSPRERPPRILGVGRLVEKKGFELLVEACAALARRSTDFDCAIVGAGPLEEELRERIRRLGVGDHVRLLGPRTQEEVARLLQGAAVLAVPSVVASDGNREGLPTVLVEAMALGTPCVGTDVTGIPELVRDGDNGLSVPQRDPDALAAALGRLLGDSALRERLAVSARRRVEADFDIDRNAVRLRELLGWAASDPPVPEPVQDANRLPVH